MEWANWVQHVILCFSCLFLFLLFSLYILVSYFTIDDVFVICSSCVGNGILESQNGRFPLKDKVEEVGKKKRKQKEHQLFAIDALFQVYLIKNIRLIAKFKDLIHLCVQRFD